MPIKLRIMMFPKTKILFFYIVMKFIFYCFSGSLFC